MTKNNTSSVGHTLTPEGRLLIIRLAKVEDVPALVRLERHGGMEELYSEADFHVLIGLGAVNLYVAEFANGSPSPGPIAYVAFVGQTDNSVGVPSLVVEPSLHRKGIGKAFLLSLVPPGVKTEACVRESDVRAQFFLKACGFRCVSINPIAFPHPPEPGYVFTHEPV